MQRVKSDIARLAVLFAATVALTGCGGGSGASGTPPAPTPAAPVPTPAPVPGTAGDLSSTVQPTTYTTGGREATAYAALNAARLAGGFGTVAQNVALDDEANNQASFVAANYAIDSGFGGLDWNAVALAALQPDGIETGHIQLSTLPGYTAYSATDRAVHFGYPSTGIVAESASFFDAVAGGDNGTTCVTDLLSSPGHRQAILDPRFRDVGIGYSTLSQPFSNTNATLFGQACYIATAAQTTTYSSTGEATAPTGWVAIFPADGATVSSIGDSHGHGYAPSVTVDSSLALTVTSFTITDGSGNVVPTTLNLDAGQSGFANWAFATPNAVLAVSTTYTATFAGSAGGAAISKTWTFTTPAQ